MADDRTGDQENLLAGDLSSWLSEMIEAISGDRDSDVPCNGCTGCCTSFQFIHIGPDETDTLSHIPGELLFPAPLLPRGYFVLGYDERGHCPMLVDNRCSIYEHRPRTCRTYDCRVFPAAGLAADDDKPLIAERARRWQFSYSYESDRTLHAAVQTASSFIRDHSDLLPDRSRPRNATQLAVLAVRLHHLFLQRDEESGRTTVVEPDPDAFLAEATRHLGSPPVVRREGRHRQRRAPRHHP